jgi:hypothetical protein
MYVFKGLGVDPTLMHEQLTVAAPMTPIVNNPTVPATNQPGPMSFPVNPGSMVPGVTPPGYVMIFGRLISYTQIGFGLAILVGGFFLWKHYKTTQAKPA